MAIIKQKMKIANNLVKSESGIYEGAITSLGFGTGTRVEKNGRDIEEIEFSRFELCIAFEGTNEPIKVKTYTGVSINAEPVEVRYEGRGKKNEVPIYNRFTTLLLALGLLKEDELLTVNDETLERIEKGLDGLVGQVVKGKLGKDKGGYFAIDLGTLELKK
jgi:hypothetical protein